MSTPLSYSPKQESSPHNHRDNDNNASDSEDGLYSNNDLSQSNSLSESKVNSYNNSSSDDDDYSDGSYKKPHRSKKHLQRKRARKDKKKKKPKNKKKTRQDYVTRFIDDQAEEDENADSEIEDAELSREKQKETFEQHFPKRNPMMDPDELLERVQRNVDEQNELLNPYDNVEINGLQPTLDDPKLWLVKCKIGKERESVENLYHKYFAHNKPKKDLVIKILSAASFDSLKGYIYIEAFKEANVREAIIGIGTLRETSIKIVPLNEMTQIFSYDKITKVDLKPKQFVRMKSGLYEGDLAQVIWVVDPINKIYIKLIPRINEQLMDDKVPKDKIGEHNKKIKKNIKPRQKLFNPHDIKSELKNISSRSKNSFKIGTCLEWNKQIFKDGFLIKIVKAKSLITENVVPKIEELKIFELSHMEHNNDNDEDAMHAHMDADFLSSAINESSIKRKRRFERGDRVKINQGNLKGITAKVISHIDKIVQIYPNIEGMEKSILEMPEEYLVKQFLPGECVYITNGINVGNTGLIMEIKDDIAIVYSETSNTHLKVSSRDLILINELQRNNQKENKLYKIGELVKLSNTNKICYILDANQYTMKLIDTRNEIQTVSIRDVFKLSTHRISGVDGHGNPIAKDDPVMVIKGQFKGKKATVRNIFANYVFLYNNEFASSNGIFCDSGYNVEILGSELLYDADGIRTKINRRNIPEKVRVLLGKTVKIINGDWKGYTAIVKDVSDKKATIELSSKPKIIKMDLTCIQGIDSVEEGNGFGLGNNAVTPRAIQPKTPAYYPQSPGWNNSSSTPGYF